MTGAPQMEPACLGVPGAMLYYKTQGTGRRSSCSKAATATRTAPMPSRRT
jgi:hypothetical protein